jgi:membrane protease YdiL (CAAX protease family)
VRPAPLALKMRTANKNAKVWLSACVGLLIAFGLPELELGRLIAPGQGIAASLAREAVWWAIAATLVAYVLLVERRSLSSIGFRRPTPKTVLFGVLAAVLLFATVVFSYSVLFPLLGLKMNQEAVAQITRNPLWVQVSIFIRAAVVEEILYRGYPIERVEELTGYKWLAFLVSVLVFILAHVAYWGGAQLIVVGFGAVILALLYLWRRDLICNMIAHFLVDLVGFLAAGASRGP